MNPQTPEQQLRKVIIENNCGINLHTPEIIDENDEFILRSMTQQDVNKRPNIESLIKNFDFKIL